MFSQSVCQEFCPEGGRNGRGACMAGRGRAWQERRPLQRTVRILLKCILVTVRNEVAKVMFLHLFVCPQGGLPQCMLGYQPSPREQTPPGADTPPRADTPPGADTPPPWGSRHPPSVDTPREQAPTPPADGYCCGRYASYWNAFLFIDNNAFRFQCSGFAHKQWTYTEILSFLAPNHLIEIRKERFRFEQPIM